MIEIYHIKQSLEVFDLNIREGTFFKPGIRDNGEPGFVPMSEEEQELFKKTNFAVGYPGKEKALSSWAAKQCRGLKNINFESPISQRDYLWQQLNRNWDAVTKEIEAIADRSERARRWNEEKGYWILRQFRAIAETSRKHDDIRFWFLSQHDLESAQLFARFIGYLAQN